MRAGARQVFAQDAQDHVKDIFSDCVVKVRSGGETGTGFFIDDEFIVTAAHILKGDDAEVTWRDQAETCTIHEKLVGPDQPVQKLSPWPDLAILKVPPSKFAAHPCMRLSPTRPRTRAPALIIGFPNEGRTTAASTRAMSYVGGHSTRSGSRSHYYLVADEDVAGGFSGCAVLIGAAVDHVVVGTRDASKRSGGLTVRLSEVEEFEPYFELNRTFFEKNDRWNKLWPEPAEPPGPPTKHRLMAAIATMAVAFALLVLFLRADDRGNVTPGALGVNVEPSSTSNDLDENVAADLAFSRRGDALNEDLSNCDGRDRRHEVVRFDSEHANQDPNVAASIRIDFNGDRTARLIIAPTSTRVASGLDPFLFDELLSRPAVLLEPEAAATEVFPELDGVLSTVAALDELSKNTPSSLETSRCLFGLAASRIERASVAPRVQPFIAALEILQAVTWIRQESNQPGSAADTCSVASAGSALDCATQHLAIARELAAGDARLLANIEANETGVTLLRLVAQDGQLADGVSFLDADAAIASAAEIAALDGQSPDGAALARTAAARMAMAAAVTRGVDCTGGSNVEPNYLQVAADALATEPEPDTAASYRANRLHARATLSNISCDYLDAERLLREAIALATGSQAGEYEVDLAGTLLAQWILSTEPKGELVEQLDSTLSDVIAYVDSTGDVAVEAHLCELFALIEASEFDSSELRAASAIRCA